MQLEESQNKLIRLCIGFLPNKLRDIFHYTDIFDNSVHYNYYVENNFMFTFNELRKINIDLQSFVVNKFKIIKERELATELGKIDKKTQCFALKKLKEEELVLKIDNCLMNARDLQELHNTIKPDLVYKELCKSIAAKQKSKKFTSALLDIVWFLHAQPFHIYKKRVMNLLASLLCSMNCAHSILRLFEIDPDFCDDLNILCHLANQLIDDSEIDSAVTILNKITEAEPYHSSIAQLNSKLDAVKNRKRLKDNFQIDFSEINEMSGVEFEKLVLDRFFSLGFSCQTTSVSGDFGADIILENKLGTKIIVQCKRFASRVNLKAVQEVIGAMGYYSGDLGIVITNNDFLNSAVQLAAAHDIELWDGERLLKFLNGDLSFSSISA